MLSRPFRGMTRARLLILLVLLLALEGAGGAGLYLNNHTAAAGIAKKVVASPTAVSAATMYVTAMPSLLIAGKPGSFASRVPELANKTVTYRVRYSDGKTQTARAICDVSGYSSSTFLLRYAPVQRRETITVQLLVGKATRISTDFSVLLPAKS